VEKLQSIATKFRRERETGKPNPNFMRQYYDVYCLLGDAGVRAFIGTPAYQEHKAERFPKADRDIPIAQNEAFLLSDPNLRSTFAERYYRTSALYYRRQPDFEMILRRIQEFLMEL
jgi:hypothetical protein